MRAPAVTAAAVATAVLVLSGCGSGKIDDVYQRQRLDAVKLATVRYKSLNTALVQGYRPLPGCIDELGQEYVQLQLMRDQRIDLLQPEQLFYQQEPGGKPPVLQGVGYFVPKKSLKPPLSPLGHLDGPVPGQFRGESAHFELHVWLYGSNPDGVLAFFNPDVTCP